MTFEEVIGKLEEAFKTQYKQAKGEKDKTPFLDTFPGDYKKLDDLLSDYFETTEYNGSWKEVLADDERSELKDGIKLRLQVVYMCMWKKALLRACAKRTDVDVVFDDEIASINTGLQSLALTKSVIAGKTEDKSSSGNK